MEAVASPCTFSPPVANIISVDEFLDMSNSPEYADCRFELVDAKVNEMSHPNYLHGFVLTELGSILRSHVKVQGHGTVIISEIGFVLGALSCLASRSKSPTS
ncbi:MAG: Uma2 family endonuclease, partial [Chloroflexi bacterium]|nr:Uma2 family endonuclease [Chloroflexota bacterium]